METVKTANRTNHGRQWILLPLIALAVVLFFLGIFATKPAYAADPGPNTMAGPMSTTPGEGGSPPPNTIEGWRVGRNGLPCGARVLLRYVS